MKKILHLSALVIFFTIVSCDKVSNPIVVKPKIAGSKFVTKTNKDVSDTKKVLLEDYTGQRCPNCPAAAAIIKNVLLPAYSNLIVIAVHQGDAYAEPYGKFTNDFRTDAGETWGGSGGFGPLNTWPTGLINRRDYNGNGLKLTSTKWPNIMPMTTSDPFVLKLDVTTEYDTIVRALNVYVKGYFKLPYPNAIKIIAVYTEEGITGKQINGSAEIEDYEFEHMLRGDINGTWGVDLTTKAALAKDSASWTTSGFPLPESAKGGLGKSINDKNVSMVVFAYDVTTKEVLQVEKIKIR